MMQKVVNLMLPNIMMAQHGHLVGIWQQEDINYLVLELKQQVWLLVDLPDIM
jgi:hypothetical protein